MKNSNSKSKQEGFTTPTKEVGLSGSKIQVKEETKAGSPFDENNEV
jgi:hypothetical protein